MKLGFENLPGTVFNNFEEFGKSETSYFGICNYELRQILSILTYL